MRPRNNIAGIVGERARAAEGGGPGLVGVLGAAATPGLILRPVRRR